jgi:hypothetical protein
MIDDRRHVEVGVVQVLVVGDAAAVRVVIVPADGQGVDVVRVPQVLVERVRVLGAARLLAFLQQLPLLVVITVKAMTQRALPKE